MQHFKISGSLQRSPTNQTKDFQKQCSWSPPIWCRVLEGLAIHCHILDVFQTRCLRRILGIFWPRTISNGQEPSPMKTFTAELIQRHYQFRLKGRGGGGSDKSTEWPKCHRQGSHEMGPLQERGNVHTPK